MSLASRVIAWHLSCVQEVTQLGSLAHRLNQAHNRALQDFGLEAITLFIPLEVLLRLRYTTVMGKKYTKRKSINNK